jgi:integrase
MAAQRRPAGQKKASSRKSPNGAGSIYQRESDGLWVGAAYVLTTDGTRRRKVVYGRTWEEAHGKVLELLDRDRRGLAAPHQVQRVSDYLDYWLENVVRPSKRPATYAQYETMVRLYLKPKLGKHRLDRLTVAHCQTFAMNQLAAGHSRGTVQVMVKVLSAALTRAVREEVLSRNVARLVSLPPAVAHERQRWTVDQLRAFLVAARPDPLYPVFVLLAFYGLRRGEALGLRWADVDLDGRVLRVHNQVQRIRGELVQGPVKTNAGRRALPLLDPVAAVLEAQREHQDADRAAAGAEWVASGMVVTTRTGRPVEPRNFARSFARICASAGVPAIRPHDLRHMCATLLKVLDVPARDAMAILGHSRITVTLEIYTDSDEAAHRAALDRLSKLLEH